MTLIKFDNVSSQGILHHLTGTFSAGCITTLVGPSGAGKTTCLKHINALISPDAGSIYYKGENLNDLNVINIRKDIGMAFQSSPMIEGTVYDNLNLPRDIFNLSLSRKEAVEMLERVDLNASFLDKSVRKLSGGERSRVSLARTFVNKPKVLLLDEITSSLDYILVREIERLIMRIQKEIGVTIIWITHDLAQAKRVSDEVWFLKEGTLIEQGTVRDIEQSSHPDIQSFLKGER